jgi:hypothetical protein
VQGALEHFDGERYDLHAWCIMPNHVHVLLRPRSGASLCGILQSWKSYTAKKCNEILGRSGSFWQDDYFDRYMRDQADVEATAAYILNNGGRNSVEDQAMAGGRASRPTTSPMRLAVTNGGQDARPPKTRPPTARPQSSGGRASRPATSPMQLSVANGGQDARPPTKGGRDAPPPTKPTPSSETGSSKDIV